jgi:hypothetical protein
VDQPDEFPREKQRRVQFPILAPSRPGSVELTRTDIACAEEEEDLHRKGYLTDDFRTLTQPAMA